MTALTESAVEDGVLDLCGELGFSVIAGPTIAPGEPAAERAEYGETVIVGRLTSALARLNPSLPTSAIEEAIRRVLHPDSPSLITNNQAFHRMLVDGVQVEVQHAAGGIRGEIVKLIDFDDPDNNDWLAVNQFTVVENGHNRRPDIVVFMNGLPRLVFSCTPNTQIIAHSAPL